ncbi:MAG: thioredoxin fold domain-containing protein [Candidatus Obscuribacterales bacterium]|nr:thioredoxin fold domain-containing protein [Candidatus Obscuribacterales bacterium]
MKELFIVFVIALVIGSIMNGSQEVGTLMGSEPQSAQQSAPAEESLNRLASVDENNFDKEVIDSQTPVLVDFYSDTCAPCKKMEPILAELATEYQGSLKVARIDVLRAPHLAQKYQISAIPVFMVFKEGKCESSATGAMPKTEVVAMFKPYLSALSKGAAD